MERIDSKKIVSNIRALAKRRGMNLGAFELAIGVSVGYLSRVDKYTNTPCIDTIASAAKVLDVTIEELLYEEFTPPLKTVQMEVYEEDYKNIAEISEKRECSVPDVIHTFFNKRFFKDEEGEDESNG